MNDTVECRALVYAPLGYAPVTNKFSKASFYSPTLPPELGSDLFYPRSAIQKTPDHRKALSLLISHDIGDRDRFIWRKISQDRPSEPPSFGVGKKPVRRDMKPYPAFGNAMRRSWGAQPL